LASGIDSEIAPDVDANGNLKRKRTPQELLEAVVAHQATGQLDTTDVGVADLIELDEGDIDYLVQLSDAYEGRMFIKRGAAVPDPDLGRRAQRDTWLYIHATAWEYGGYNDGPVHIHRDEIADLVAAREADGTLAVLPITRGLSADDQASRTAQVEQFAKGERWIPGSGGTAYGNGENFGHNPYGLYSYHDGAGGSILAFVPVSAEAVLMDDMTIIQDQVHETLWALDHAVRKPNEESLTITTPTIRGKQIFQNTHGDRYTNAVKGSIDPTDAAAVDNQLSRILRVAQQSGYGNNRAARYQMQVVKDRIAAQVKRMADAWVQLERSYDRTQPMSAAQNVRIRQAQRALMHADATTLASILGYDITIADGASSFSNGEVATRQFFSTIRIAQQGSRADGIGSINHINVLNRSAMIVSQDGWVVDDIVDAINDVVDANGNPIYKLEIP
jgi:hypothetical protein